MQISKDTVVLIDYTLTDDAKETLDSTEGQEPLAYLHGGHNLIEGLEDALDGKNPGDELKVSVPPEKAYGDVDPQRVQAFPRSEFEGIENLEVGMHLEMQTEEGEQLVFVTEVAEDQVTLDGNHPLAGETLHFDVKVVEVRAATEDELSHGHAHAPGGHDH